MLTHVFPQRPLFTRVLITHEVEGERERNIMTDVRAGIQKSENPRQRTKEKRKVFLHIISRITSAELSSATVTFLITKLLRLSVLQRSGHKEHS